MKGGGRYAMRGCREVVKNSGVDLVQEWNAYLGEKPIFVPKGIFDTGSETLEVTLSNYFNGYMWGCGRATRIQGSAVSMLDILNTAWIQGAPFPRLRLEELFFEHDAPAGAKCLDLTYGTVDLIRVWTNNVNAVKTDKIGIAMEATGNPADATWIGVGVAGFGIGVRSKLDHLHSVDLGFASIEQICFDMAEAMNNMLYGFSLYGGAIAGVKLMQTSDLGRNNHVYNPRCENTVDFTNPLFNHVDPFGEGLIIHDFDSSRSNITLFNDPGKFYYESRAGYYPSAKWLVNKTVNAAETTIPHGFKGGITPTIILIYHRNEGHIWRSKTADDTNIYLRADLDGRTCDIYLSKYIPA